MFKLTPGSFRSLEEALIAEVISARSQDPLTNLLVLSPSAHMLTRLQTQLARRQPGFVNIHSLTFYALAERLLAEGPTREDRVVTEPALYREIVHNFLLGRNEVPFTSREQLRHGDGPVPKGLPGALAATLKDLQDSGARVVDCAQVAREGHLGDALEEAIPALELNVLMYDVLRKRGLRTGADFIRRAAERISQSAWLSSQKTIFLYGFYDLTGVQLDLVLALAKHPDARLYFPYEAGNSAYAFAEKLLKDPTLTSKSKIQPAIDCPRPVLSTEAWSCSGTHDEIWLTAKKILELADSGVPYAQMALLARTLDPYLNTIREVFENHHIPFALHTEEPVGGWPLVKSAREILQAILRTQETTWGEHAEHALQRLQKGITIPLDLSETEQRIWAGILDTIGSLKELDALGKTIGWERFLDVLEEKLDALKLPLSSNKTAGVQVMDVMTARGLSFDSVFLVGLNEKLFPRLIREDPFLSDAARSSLAQALGSRLGRKLDGYQEERLLFQLAIETAEKNLHLSCQRSDEEGKALVISLYLHDFLQKNGLALKRLPRTWPEKIREVSVRSLTPKEVSLAFHRENRDTDDLYGALGWNKDLIGHLLKSQREIETFGPMGPHDGMIGARHPLAQAILAEGLSPNTLKDLAECPFKIFSRKVLSLNPEQNAVDEGTLTAAARGEIVHNILEAFYREHPSAWEPGLKKIAARVFRTFEKNRPDLYPLAWEAEQESILAMLRRFIPLGLAEQAEDGFTPHYFEETLSEELQLPHPGLEKLRLQGRIDRLDIRAGSAPAFRVVDYKTGAVSNKKQKVETDILKGRNFQLPIYLLLVQAWLKSQGSPASKEGSATFYNLQREDAFEAPLQIDSTFWTEHGDRFYKNLRFLIKDVESGSFYIRPSDLRGYCSWCHFASICRKEHKPTQIRSEASSDRQEHEELFK